jgi:hypothetical protein
MATIIRTKRVSQSHMQALALLNNTPRLLRWLEERSLYLPLHVAPGTRNFLAQYLEAHLQILFHVGPEEICLALGDGEDGVPLPRLFQEMFVEIGKTRTLSVVEILALLIRQQRLLQAA